MLQRHVIDKRLDEHFVGFYDTHEAAEGLSGF